MTTKAVTVTTRAESQFKALTQITDKDFYNLPGGKKEPSARALQVFANQQKVSTKILSSYSDDKKASVRVLGWIGGEVEKVTDSEVVFSKYPTQIKEDTVEINYEVKARQWLIKNMKPGWGKSAKFTDNDIEYTDEGTPTPKSQQAKVQMADYIYQLKDFAVRIATTKAEARINKKLLSLDFYETGEKQFEDEEVKSVNAATGEIQKTQSTTTQDPKTPFKPDSCADCGAIKGVSQKVVDFSKSAFGRVLCFNCQKTQEKPIGKPAQEDQYVAAADLDAINNF